MPLLKRRRFFISQHSEVEARIVEELRGLCLLATPEQPQPRALEHADLSRLTHLTCAIKVCLPCAPVLTVAPQLRPYASAAPGVGMWRDGVPFSRCTTGFPLHHWPCVMYLRCIDVAWPSIGCSTAPSVAIRCCFAGFACL